MASETYGQVGLAELLMNSGKRKSLRGVPVWVGDWETRNESRSKPKQPTFLPYSTGSLRFLGIRGGREKTLPIF